jgi:O-antigen/teichoic acid export membrane protein
LIAAAWLGGGYLPNQSHAAIQALQIYSLALIPLAFYTIFTILLRGEQRMDAYTLLNLGISIIQVGAILTFMKSASNVVTLSIVLLCVQVMAALLAGIVCVAVIPDFWKIWQFSFESILPAVKAAAPIALLALLGMLYQKMSITMLSMLRGPTETGLFSAAARAVEASKTIHLAVFAALYPALAESLSERPKTDETVSKREVAYFKILVAGALLASLILYLFATPIVSVLYGADYFASVNILQILAWTLIPFSINGFLSLFLMALHREQLINLIMVASLLGLLVLSLWWIPIYGAVGAAWSFLTAEYLQAGLSIAMVLSLYIRPKESHEFSKLSR